MWSLFKEQILKVLDKDIPIRQGDSYQAKEPWFINEVEALVKRKKAAYMRRRQEGSGRGRQCYKLARKDLRSALTKGSTVREATGHLWLLKMFQKISFQQNPVALFLALEITLSGFCGAQNSPATDIDLKPTDYRFTGTTTSVLRTATSCYACNDTEDCTEYQLANYTREKCEDPNAGCWIWMTILGNETTVARGCRESCTNANAEESCNEVMDMMYCIKCCPDPECNVEVLFSHGTRIREDTCNMFAIFSLFISMKSMI
ncbi:uncharacterized protein [Chiloscyllium punctatum]|uniref:uncharacterized protein n=1 Tax=Chiloscyllium punctatum TaxID=137246 RepID=UPI003B63D83A